MMPVADITTTVAKVIQEHYYASGGYDDAH